MDRLAFNASAAIAESRTAQHMVNNELANVSTPGFKRSFESAMQSVKAEGAGFASRIQPKSLNVDTIIMTAGIALIATGNDLDIAMNDKAVLGVTGNDGTIGYTRRGDLRVNAKGVLETGNGHAVRSQSGGTITIPPGFKAVINTDGSIYADNPTNVGVAKPVLIDRLMLRDADGVRLSRRLDGLFAIEDQPIGTEIPDTKAL